MSPLIIFYYEKEWPISSPAITKVYVLKRNEDDSVSHTSAPDIDTTMKGAIIRFRKV